MAANDIASATILGSTDRSGYVAEIGIEGWTIGATFDFAMDADNKPTSATPYFDVVSEGFSPTDGTLGTVNRRVYLTAVHRKASPDNAQPEQRVDSGILYVQCTLSDWIYDDDKDGGAGTSGTDPVFHAPAGWGANTADDNADSNAATGLTSTNNSTTDYPKVALRFHTMPFQRVAGTITVEAVAAHRHWQGGRQVARVEFHAEDQSTNEATSVSTALVASTYTLATGIPVPVHPWSLDFSQFDQNEIVTVNALAKPFVGDNDSVFDSRTTGDGVAQPDERTGPLPLLCDKDDTITTYAVVDTATGDNATAAPANTIAGAETNRYLTLGAAVTGIRTFNNASKGFDSADGGVVLVVSGNYAFPGTAFTANNTRAFVTIQPHPTLGNEAGCIINSATNTAVNGYLRVRDMTVAHGNTGGFRGNTTGGLFWLDDCTLNMTGLAPAYTWRVCYATNNSITQFTNGFNPFSTNKSPWEKVIGNVSTALLTATFYYNAGNTRTVLSYQQTGSTSGHQPSDNAICQYNISYNNTGTFAANNQLSTNTLRGCHYICNVVERTGSSTTPLVQCAADSGTSTDVKHVTWCQNTVEGQRCNINYNEIGSTRLARTLSRFAGNAFNNFNCKADTFGTPNGARSGAFPTLYGVGFSANNYRESIFDAEFAGFNFTQGDPLWTDDNSRSGSDTGEGDYTPSESSSLRNRVESHDIGVPFDITGRAYPLNGTASIGAYQYDEAPPAPEAPLPRCVTGITLANGANAGETGATWADPTFAIDGVPNNPARVVLDPLGDITSDYLEADIVLPNAIKPGISSVLVGFKIARDEDDYIARLTEILVVNDDGATSNLLLAVIEIPSISGGYSTIWTRIAVDGAELDPAKDPKLRVRVSQAPAQAASCQVLLDEIIFPEKICAGTGGFLGRNFRSRNWRAR